MSTEVRDCRNCLWAPQRDRSRPLMHLLDSTGRVSGCACSLPRDEVEVLACLELKMFAFAKIQPC